MRRNLLLLAAALVMSFGINAQVVLPLLPTAHGLTGNQPAYNAQQQQQFPAMANGWNWWSTYIDLSSNGLSMLETMLGTDATVINSQLDGFNTYANGQWTGNLSTVSNNQMYLINMGTTPSTIELTGQQKIATESYNLTVQNGWNWIGYPSDQTTEINTALQNYPASDGDVINSQLSGFATYNGSTNVWSGGLTSLVPGEGYKLQSNNATATTFHFTKSNSRYTGDDNNIATVWSTNYKEYRDNMCLIAIVNLQGDEVRSDEYEVGAFVGNNCRGAFNLKYIEDLDRYLAFVSICGVRGENIQFRLIDHNTSDVYAADANNIISYEGDKVTGSLHEPYVLNFNTLMDNDEFVASHLDLFPNPAKRGQMVRMSIPANHSDLKVIITNTLGMTVKTLNMSSDETSFTVNMAPGVYTVKVVSSDKQLYVEKLIVE